MIRTLGPNGNVVFLEPNEAQKYFGGEKIDEVYFGDKLFPSNYMPSTYDMSVISLANQLEEKRYLTL